MRPGLTVFRDILNDPSVRDHLADLGLERNSQLRWLVCRCPSESENGKVRDGEVDPSGELHLVGCDPSRGRPASEFSAATSPRYCWHSATVVTTKKTEKAAFVWIHLRRCRVEVIRGGIPSSPVRPIGAKLFSAFGLRRRRTHAT